MVFKVSNYKFGPSDPDLADTPRYQQILEVLNDDDDDKSHKVTYIINVETILRQSNISDLPYL